MSKITKLIFCFLMFFAFCAVVSKEISSQKLKEKEKLRLILQNAYQASYDNGYRSFLRQFMDNEPGATYQYTSQVQEKSVDEKTKETKEYREAIEKGYVDGYHKASEMNNCPRIY